MGPLSDAEKVQNTCSHQFTLVGYAEHFDANQQFGATCNLCIRQISFSAWDRCPRCFNDLSKIHTSSVPGQFQGGGPVDDGQTYGPSTLEKQCATCGMTVWKYKT